MQNNPNFFSEEVSRRFPTSIDMLEPSSQLLAATTTLPYPPNVKLHSIVGIGQARLDGEPSDGIVPVNSARLCRVASERDIYAKHTDLNKDDESVEEIKCILFQHLRENGTQLSRSLR